MFTAPELVEAEAVEVNGEVDVTLELEHRVLAQRVVRCEERAETHACHIDLHLGDVTAGILAPDALTLAIDDASD